VGLEMLRSRVYAQGDFKLQLQRLRKEQWATKHNVLAVILVGGAGSRLFPFEGVSVQLRP
jgi:hypothetical protein